MNEEFKTFLTESGISEIHYSEKNDITSGLLKLIFTTAIVNKLSNSNYNFYQERFCFEDRLTALTELREWHERDFEMPYPVGWIACRGVTAEQLRDAFPNDYAHDVLQFGSNSIKIRNHSDASNFERHELEHKIAYLKYSNQIEY